MTMVMRTPLLLMTALLVVTERAHGHVPTHDATDTFVSRIDAFKVADGRFPHNLRRGEVHDLSGLARAIGLRAAADGGAHATPRRSLRGVHHTDGAKVRVRLLGTTWAVHLTPHDDLFEEGYAHTTLDATGAPLRTEGPLDCVYRAVATSEDDHTGTTLTGAFTLCDGHVSGTLYGGADTRAITVEPLPGVSRRSLSSLSPPPEPNEEDGLTIVYDHADVAAEGGSPMAVHMPTDVPRKTGKTRISNVVDGLTPPRRPRTTTKRLAQVFPPDSFPNTREKIVTVNVFNDAGFYAAWGNATHTRAAAAFAQAAAFHQLMKTQPTRAGGVSSYYATLKLQGMFTFQLADPFKLPLTAASLVDSRKLLTTFSTWLSAASAASPDVFACDVGVLLSGAPWDPALGASGWAWVGTVCHVDNFYNAALVQTGYSLASEARTTAHEIGHSIGMQHDDVAVPGFSPSKCVNIDPGVMQSGSTRKAWSTCSAEWVRLFFSPDSPVHEYNTPDFPACAESMDFGGVLRANVTSPVCGDGLREGNEECDCPGNDCSTVDPCCDGATCRLQANATCSPAQGSCCSKSTCQVRPQGAVCRPSVGSCDVPDTCDGVSPTCGVDFVAAPGTSCITSTLKRRGRCGCGVCLSAVEECLVNGDAGTWLGPCGGAGTVNPTDCGSDMACYTSSSAPWSCSYWVSPYTPWPEGIACGVDKVCAGNACVPVSSFSCPSAQAVGSFSPTIAAQALGSKSPTRKPTTKSPTKVPTRRSTAKPTSRPTRRPTPQPTKKPTRRPTLVRRSVKRRGSKSKSRG